MSFFIEQICSLGYDKKMNPEFLPHNSHLDTPQSFAKTDIHLRRMNAQKYVFHSEIIEQLPTDIPGIYNLGGGRQIGKTTLLKQWMLKLLDAGINPKCIAFISCELILDQTSLYRIVMEQLDEMPHDQLRYLILDEITYVLNWEKAIKFLADAGALDNVMLIISGSDLILMQNSRKLFPGRRGKADQVDFHYHPLTFSQYLTLKKVPVEEKLTQPFLKILYDEFQNYLIHGGFLTAINEYATTQSISLSTLATYSDWIRGDMIKHGKKEYYLRELLSAIVKYYMSQISWRNLASGLSIDHAQTVIEYVDLLESMDTTFVQQALLEDKLVGAPKKQKKIMFCDPFIFHAVRSWLHPTQDPFTEQIKKYLDAPQLCSKLVEAIVVTHFRQFYQTYYIKSESEVDVAYIEGGKFWPIEIKWTSQLRLQDLKQVLKYKNAKIWAKVQQEGEIQGIPVVPLPWALFSFFD